MKRLINSELIQKVKDLMLSVWSDSEGNLEVGKNLEVDGNLNVNGAIQPSSQILFQVDNEGFNGIAWSGDTFTGTLLARDGADGNPHLYYSPDDETNIYEVLDESNVNKLAHLYRHTIEISNDTSSVVFQANLDNNVVIDSVQDLTTALGSTQLSASGYIGANIVSKITIGANASAITIKTNGGNKALTDITGFVVTDSVTL